MFEVMHQKGLGTSFQAPISKEELELCGFAFVDDLDIRTTPTKQLHKYKRQLIAGMV
jgi:hypothetical protein